MFKINLKSSIPIYKQVELGIKDLILKETLTPGMKLYSVREIASILNVNANTISKAYKSLEIDGIIETLKGKGTFISEGYKNNVDKKKIEYISENLKKLIIEISYVGISKENFIELVLETYSEFQK